jgi:hypothetical protein
MSKRKSRANGKQPPAPVEPQPVGRPTKYRPELIERAYRLALLVTTDKEIAEGLGICEATLNNYKVEYPEFLEALKRGKLAADSDVAHSLHMRSLGYEAVERKAVKLKQADGSEKVEMAEEIRHVPADTTAQIFWLKNRRRLDWKDSHRLEGDPNNPIAVFAGIKIVLANGTTLTPEPTIIDQPPAQQLNRQADPAPNGSAPAINLSAMLPGGNRQPKR